MVEKDKQDFVNTIIGVFQLYGKKINEFILNTYWETLENYELAEVKKAIQQHIQNPDSGQFLPKPADIVKYLYGTSETQAMRAWSIVSKAIRSIGADKTVVFDDQIIHQVIYDMGGWINLCMSTIDEIPFREKDFEKRYAAYVQRPPSNYPKKLIGRWESSPDSSESSRKPHFVGNTKKAISVYESGIDKKLNYSTFKTLDESISVDEVVSGYQKIAANNCEEQQKKQLDIVR